jgi:hypothetical protein
LHLPAAEYRRLAEVAPEAMARFEANRARLMTGGDPETP